MTLLGREQIYNPGYSIIEKMYIRVFGMPIVGLRIRGNNVMSLIPHDRKHMRVLDAGSGTGVLSFELARRFPDATILGIDILEESVDASRRVAEKIGNQNVIFRKAKIEKLEEKEVFDLILCVDILEHIEDDLGALRELYNAAAAGGILILHVPALYRRYPIWKKRLNFDVETHVRIGYQKDDIENKVRESGFVINEIGYTYGFFETLANNLSYMITKARMKNKMIYSLLFPLLLSIAKIGKNARPEKLGAGIYIVARK